MSERIFGAHLAETVVSSTRCSAVCATAIGGEMKRPPLPFRQTLLGVFGRFSLTRFPLQTHAGHLSNCGAGASLTRRYYLRKVGRVLCRNCD